MQIILLEKVTNLGQLGEVVKVKEGYARNYLIPQGKAKRATAANLAEFEARRADLEKAEQERRDAAAAQAAKLEGLPVSLTRKAGVDGKLFGSVTGADIAEALVAKGVEVSKVMVRMPDGPIKQAGEHTVTLALHTDVVVSLTLTVVGES